jgi:hypothetical protein
MFVLELFFAFIVAIVLSGLFALATRRGFQWPGFLWFFLIIFLATWAGGVWVRPFGPSLFGIYWLPFVLAGLIFVLFLAISTPGQPPKNRRETIDMLERIEQEKKLDQFTYVTLSIFFWILLCVLITAIIIRYLL